MKGRRNTGTGETREPDTKQVRPSRHPPCPPAHTYPPPYSIRYGDEGRGHHTRPPFFIPSRDHSHRTPCLPRCSPPSPCALPRHRDEAACTNPATPAPPLAFHPRPSPYPAVSQTHQRPSVPMPMPLRLAQPATALVRTTGAVRRRLAGLAVSASPHAVVLG
ncbi:hypothetical protein BJ912DRAFT_451151 [Pholiota molesta]|nr:hypothetical protein BJ912DRAFT_451151 [Pholiota molesta]